jgi:hypothetical protein
MTIIRAPKAEPQSGGRGHADLAREQGRQAAEMTLASLVMFCVTWGAMWGPIYLGLPGLRDLYPVFLVMLILTGVFALIALRYGALALRGYESRYPGSVVWSVIGALAMLIIPLPALWFGDVPLAFLGG